MILNKKKISRSQWVDRKAIAWPHSYGNSLSSMAVQWPLVTKAVKILFVPALSFIERVNTGRSTRYNLRNVFQMMAVKPQCDEMNHGSSREIQSISFWLCGSLLPSNSEYADQDIVLHWDDIVIIIAMTLITMALMTIMIMTIHIIMTI